MRSNLTLGVAVGCAVALGLGGAAHAAETFVDVNFDRSAWEAVLVGATETETFSTVIAQADTLVFDGGIESVASDPIATPSQPNHRVDGDRFVGTLRPADSTSPGYLTFVWTFPQPVTAFGADFYSIGGSRQVSVQGHFDGMSEAFDLRALFGAKGGLDQGFFGIATSQPFESITLIALGTGTNDAFTVDRVTTELPEPASGMGAVAVASLLAFRRLRGRPVSRATRERRGR